MKLIKINRSSIEKNPNAGRTEMLVPVNKEYTFRLEGVLDLPGFVEGKDYYKREWGSEIFGDPSTYYVEGGLINQDIAEAVSKIPGITFGFRQDVKHVQFMTPEPEYHYKYEDTKIECLHCHNQILQSEIIDDEVATEDDEYSVQKCPVCGAIDEFEPIEYEKIEDALKELNLSSNHSRQKY